MMSRRACSIRIRPIRARPRPSHGRHPSRLPTETRLTFAQLNATASVEGTFVYTPGPGYVLPVGTHTLWVTFTPVDDRNAYSRCRLQFQLLWPRQRRSSPGQHLPESSTAPHWTMRNSMPRRRYPENSTTLPRQGEVLPPGMHTLSVTFTRRRQRELRYAHNATVSLTVARASLPSNGRHPIRLRTARSSAPRNSACRVVGSGRFEYNPGLGAVLAAGEHRLSVVFTPADTLGYSYIADCRITDCGQGNSCHQLADTGSDCLRRGHRRCPA